MSVRKRIWRNGDGSQGEAWIVAYTDQGGKRRIKSFDRKRDAEGFQAGVVNVRAGLHVPDSQSIMVAEAGRLWLKNCEATGLERTTLDYYRQHVELHIVPLIGAVKLSQLHGPYGARLRGQARASDRSQAMVRKVRGSLGAMLADAQERGLAGQNVVHALRARRRGKETRADKRQGKLKIGVDIPSPDEIRAFMPCSMAAGGRCS